MTGGIVGKGGQNRKRVKPKKPYPDFPLTPHQSGKWCKKVRGKLFYFGDWDDPDGALREWLSKEHQIRAHGELATDNSEADIKWLLNAFLDAKELQCDSGDLSQRSYLDYKKACDRIYDHFGPSRLSLRLSRLTSKGFGHRSRTAGDQ